MSGQVSASERQKTERSALLAGIAAFSFWGIIPVYWKLLQQVPAHEILAHRFIWTAVFLILLLTWQRRWPEIVGSMRSRRAMIFCAASSIAIAINWFFFIWAVNINRVIETSLGYFMTPLVNVLLGAIFLRERLNRWQIVSVLLATSAVLYLTFGYGRFPWIAVILCCTFGLYGLLRKQSRTAAIPGLFFETILLAPFALLFLGYLWQNQRIFFGPEHTALSAVLISTGFVTALPLIWFGHAARHLRLTTVGFLQYLAPSGSFSLGVFLYREPFTQGHLITFVLIWIALGIYTADAVLRWRRGPNLAAVALKPAP